MPHALESERLRLRPFVIEDLDQAYEALEGHPDVWKYDPGRQRTREQRAAIIQRYIDQNDEDECGTLAVIRKSDDLLIGYVGLQLYVLPREPLATPEVELYYKFGRDHWGQGYATEACRAMIRFAFDELRLARIVTMCDTKNEPSVRMLQRLGMRVEAAPPKWEGSTMGTLENDNAK